MMVAQETGVKRYTQIGHGFLRWFRAVLPATPPRKADGAARIPGLPHREPADSGRL